MPRLTEEVRERRRRRRETPQQSLLDVGAAAFRAVDRPFRVLGRAFELGLAGRPETEMVRGLMEQARPGPEQFPFEPPSRADIQEGLRAASREALFDVDAALAAYEEAAPAGWGYRGLTELPGQVLAPGGLAKIGVGLAAKATPLAATVARVAPQAARPGIARATEAAIRGTGQALRAPWEVEEAIGRGLTLPVRAGWRKLRGARPAAAEVLEEAPTGAPSYVREIEEAGERLEEFPERYGLGTEAVTRGRTEIDVGGERFVVEPPPTDLTPGQVVEADELLGPRPTTAPAVPAAPAPVKRSSKDWAEIQGVKVIDPDGWDRRNFEADWNRPITQDEFATKLQASTVEMGAPVAPGQIREITGKKSSREWAELYETERGTEILDPDGWARGPGFEADWNKPITQRDFELKLGNSTIRTGAPTAPVTPGAVRAGEDVTRQRARLKEISAEVEKLFVGAPGGSGLTANQAVRYQRLIQEASSIQFDLSRPLDISKIKPAAERLSILSTDEVVVAREALRTDKAVFMAISDAASGTWNASPTVLDDIVSGTNQVVSFEKLYDTFAPVRNTLRQNYGDTIHLYRAIGQQVDKPTTNWASTREGALQYGTNIIERDVPIDDILAVNVGLRGNYEEFVVSSVRPTAAPGAPGVPAPTREMLRRIAPEQIRDVTGAPPRRPTPPGGEVPPGLPPEPPTTTRGPTPPDGGVPPALPQLQDMDEAINIATRSNLGRMIANLPIIRNIMKRVNPSAVRNTVEERGLTGRAALLFEAGQKTEQSIAALTRLGNQQRVFGRVDDAGLLTEGPLKGTALNDVRTRPDAYKGKLTEGQREWIDAAQQIEESKLAFLKNNGINIKTLEFGQGGHYAGRRVVGKYDRDGNLIDWGYLPSRRPATKLPFEKARTFQSQQEAIEKGYRYLDEDEALYLNVRAAYNRVAEKKAADWIIKNSPSIRLRGKRGTKGYEAVGGEIEGVKVSGDFSKGVFTGREATEIAALLQKELDPSLRRVPSLLSALAKINAVGRFMQLNGDASQFLIQLLYMTGARGGMKAWGKALGGFVQTLADTKYHSRLIDNNRDLLSRHRGLLTSLRGSEFTEAAQKGGLLTRGPSWAPWRLAGKALDPFARAFNGAMDTAGIQLARSLDAHLKPKTAAEYADIDAFINEIRGLASTARLGQSATLQATESNLLLAPRYNRSIASLLWDTVADGGIRGDEARLALLRSLTGLTALASAFAIAEYVRDTDEKDRTWGGAQEAVLKHITPTSPMFFTWKVGGTNIGPGTKVRSLIKLFATSKNDPRSLLEISQDNPAIRFARGNAAPLASDAWDIFSGHNYIGDPTGFFDGWTDESVGEDFSKLAKEVIAPDIMPIWVHAALLEGGTPLEAGVRGAVEFAGGRAYPMTPRQQNDEVAQERYNKPYEDLGGHAKRDVDNVVTERYGERTYPGKDGPLYKDRDDEDATLIAETKRIAGEHLSGPILTPGWEIQQTREEINEARGVHREETEKINTELYGTEPAPEPEDKTTPEYLLWLYGKTFEDATDSKGKLDFEKLDKTQAEFWSSLKSREQGMDVLSRIRNLEPEFDERIQKMLDAQRYTGTVTMERDGIEYSYWDIEDLPEVRRALVAMSGVSKRQVDKFVNGSRAEREDWARETSAGASVKSALDKAKNRGGVIDNLQQDFLRSSNTFVMAMVEGGYHFNGDEEVFKYLRTIDVPQYDYEQLYIEGLLNR